MDTEFVKRIQNLANQIIADGYKSICFWLPARSVGGGAYLFAEYAKIIAYNTDLKVYYCDFEDGYAQDLLKDDDKIYFIKYERESKNILLDEKTIVFTNSTRIIQIKKMHPETKFLFWHWETNPVGWDLLLFRDEKRKIFRMLKDSNAICYHDWSSWDMFCYQSKLTCEKQYLPLFLPEKNKVSSGELISNTEINLCWIGRLSYDKIQSLYNVIKCFSKYKTDRLKRFHIIGDGLCLQEVKKFCSKYKSSMEFIFTGTIPKTDLDDYLISHVDITFAMGTAALEAAALSIPSIVVKLSYKQYFDDLFVPLQNTIEYCVGFTTEQAPRFNAKICTFDSIVNRLEDGYKKNWGEQCYSFYMQNFCGYKRSVELLLQFLRKTKLTYNLLAKKLQFTPYNNVEIVYAIKRLKNHMLYVFFDKDIYAYLRRKFTLYKVSKRKHFSVVMLFGLIPILFVSSKQFDVIKNKIRNKKIGINTMKVEKKQGYVFATEMFKG